MLWRAQSYGCMNDPGSCELKPLNLMNCSKFWMMWMILHHELKPLNDMNYSGLGRELRVVDVINNSWLWITWMTLVHEIRPLDSMNNSGMWLIRKLRVFPANHNIELFVESRGLISWTRVLISWTRVLISWTRVIHVIHNPELLIASTSLSKGPKVVHVIHSLSSS